MRASLIVTLFVVAACGTSTPPLLPDAGTPADTGTTAMDASVPPTGDAGIDADAAAPPEDPCPPLPIPATCFGRNVVYREWGANVKGDGTYFVGGEPARLGFNRTQGTIWITKVRMEDNTYRGRMSAYGDATGGVAWISDKPCDATFAEQNRLAVWGNAGGGTMFFIVARDAADSAKLKADPQRKSDPQLRGNHCYYLAFENTLESPPNAPTASFIASATDNCGATGNGTCYYLAQEFNHRLHDVISGNTVQGNVIPGYSTP